MLDLVGNPDCWLSHEKAELSMYVLQIVDQLIVDVIRKKADWKVFNYYGEEFVHP